MARLFPCDLAQRAAYDDSLPPEVQLYATMTSVQIAANCLYGGFLLMEQHPHAAGLDALRFTEAGRYLAVPASVCAGTLEHLRVALSAGGEPCIPALWRATCHLSELLARSGLHLLCVGAVGRPASIGMPSPLLPPPGHPQGPWPGWEAWLRAWAGRLA